MPAPDPDPTVNQQKHQNEFETNQTAMQHDLGLICMAERQAETFLLK